MRKKTPFSRRSLWGILLQHFPFIPKVVRFPAMKDNKLIYKDRGNLFGATVDRAPPPHVRRWRSSRLTAIQT